jgi:prespore-specific regulator
MTFKRQDSWSPGDDTLLAQTVLEHIKKGSTQLKAFEEIGRILKRTASACGFRWNSYVRKQYKEAIEAAKESRKFLKEKSSQSNNRGVRLVEAPSSSGSSTQQQTLDFETVIHSLQQWNQEKQEQERKYNELAKWHEIRKKQFSELEKEHLSLLQLLEKASSLVNSKK